MIYLATPYWHEDPMVREQRYLKAMHCVRWHMNSGIFLYSPIVHCHPMSQIFDLPKDEAFWKTYDETMIRASEAVWFALFEGWETSKGMVREQEYAWSIKRPVYEVIDYGYYIHRLRYAPIPFATEVQRA